MVKKVPIYSIDSGVPVPDGGPTTREQVPVHDLAVGDSILFPLTMRKAVRSIASRLQESEDKRFTIRKEGEDNARIWRTK